jgi:uncharacterized membrane protein
MSHFIHSLTEVFANFVRENPRRWIYTCVFAGFAIGIALFGGVGLWLGGLFGQATNGAYTGLAIYSAWAILAMDATKAQAEAQIEVLEALVAELDK